MHLNHFINVKFIFKSICKAKVLSKSFYKSQSYIKTILSKSSALTKETNQKIILFLFVQSAHPFFFCLQIHLLVFLLHFFLFSNNINSLSICLFFFFFLACLYILFIFPLFFFFMLIFFIDPYLCLSFLLSGFLAARIEPEPLSVNNTF